MTMTVKNLRQALASLPDDMLVVLASDEEGNSYAPLEEASIMYYSPSASEAIDESWLDEAGQADSAKALVLWP